MKKPSSRIVRSAGPHSITTSKADGMKRFALLLVAAVAVAIFVGACQTQQVGEMQRESHSIQPEDAQSVRANLMMGAGELKVSGAADALMEGEFSYNVADWKPEVNYDISGDTGELSVEQGPSFRKPLPPSMNLRRPKCTGRDAALLSLYSPECVEVWNSRKSV